mgnify:CR=1 FL=1
MPTLLRMPAPAAGVHEALLLEWSVNESATFAISDVLAVIETDKAVIEIEAEADGVLHRRLVPAGRQVEVGTPIAVIGSSGDSPDDIDALAAQATEAGRSAVGAVHDDRESTGGHKLPISRVDPVSGRGASPASQRIFASPIARRMAKEAGLTLAELAGTGPGGRIVRRDVQAAVTAKQPPAAQAATESPSRPRVAAPAAQAAPQSTVRSFTDVPHSRIRTAIAARLTESKQTVPHFYLRAAPRVDALLAMRAELNTAGGQKVSVNDLVIRAVARAHRAVPEMNVTYLPDATRRYDYVDVAVAIATEGGLVTPVVRDADRLSITDIAATTADIAQRARHGRLRQQELEGGSITVTNLGMHAVEEFAAIINPPQSAILAVGAARREPVVAATDTGEELVAATVMHLVLSVDHRPLDGAIAARWLATLTDLIEHPARVLA